MEIEKWQQENNENNKMTEEDREFLTGFDHLDEEKVEAVYNKMKKLNYLEIRSELENDHTPEELTALFFLRDSLLPSAEEHGEEMLKGPLKTFSKLTEDL